jgi:hypothetical protein
VLLVNLNSTNVLAKLHVLFGYISMTAVPPPFASVLPPDLVLSRKFAKTAGMAEIN